MQASDQELLRAFVRERSEDAFRQMVNRHLNLVFATSRRILGDRRLAEETAQGVFLLLAQKAGEIREGRPLAGWLYHTARHHALNASRAEGRRRQREQTAAAMQTHETAPEPEWIAAELEGALEELPAEDRDALVLRFLDNRQLREVGVELGISEEAARKRVSRALDKLRGIFGRRGGALSTGLLTTALATQAAVVAPAGLGATIVVSALTGLTTASATAIAATHITTTLMNLPNLKTAAAILATVAATGTTTYLVREREAERLRADHQALINEAHSKLTAEQHQARESIQLRDEQIDRLKRDIVDLPRLRGEIAALRRQLAELGKASDRDQEIAVASSEPGTLSAPPEVDPEDFDQAEWEQMPVRKMYPLRRLGLDLMVHAQENNGWYPTESELPGILSSIAKAPNTKPEEILGAGDVVMLFHGNIEDIPARERSGTIIARRSDFTVGPRGSVARAYLHADGSARIVGKDSFEELLAWEQENAFPPERQSRRPE